METYYISKDIKVFYVEAKSFPEGIEEAQITLQSMIPSGGERNLLGISYPIENKGIIYKAAIEEAYDGEAEKYDCKIFVIKKGTYFSQAVRDWRTNKMIIQRTFKKLLSHPALDKNGYCLEMYPTENDILCMVPIDSTTIAISKEEALLAEARDTFRELNNVVSAFKKEQFNLVPFEGSWTPGQVSEHIMKFTSGIPDKQTKVTNRQYDEKAEPISQLFLNFSIKMKSPDFAEPGNSPLDKEVVLEIFEKTKDRLANQVKAIDLTVTGLDFALPTFGYLTRYEWIKFMLVHTQRHIRQLKNILKMLNTTNTPMLKEF